MFINSFGNFNIDIKNNKVQANKNLYPNLAPLSKDTVSFSGSKYLDPESMQEAPQAYICKQVCENAEPAYKYLNEVMKKYIRPLSKDSSVSNKKTSEVLSYKTRIKDVSSIREKVASKFAEIYNKDINDFAKLSVEKFLLYFAVGENVLIDGNRDNNDSENKEEIKEHIVNAAINILKSDPLETKCFPFSGPSLYLRYLLDDLVGLGKISTKGHSQGEVDKIIDKISKDIMSSEYDTLHVDDGLYYSRKNIAGIKHYANDIIGARILLNAADPKYTKNVMNAIKQAVKDNAIKITSIEVFEPDIKKLNGRKFEDYTYATPKQLEELAAISKAELSRKVSKAGYIGIHINLDLSNPKFAKEFNGFSGEIQILGADVEKLKDVEDLCYKIKDNKPGINAHYKKFADHFKKYYIDADSKTKKAFDDYTYELYLYQRALSYKDRGKKFPSIKELGFEDTVPKELDYNNLKKIKDECEKKINIDKNAESAISTLKNG